MAPWHQARPGIPVSQVMQATWNPGSMKASDPVARLTRAPGHQAAAGDLVPSFDRPPWPLAFIGCPGHAGARVIDEPWPLDHHETRVVHGPWCQDVQGAMVPERPWFPIAIDSLDTLVHRTARLQDALGHAGTREYWPVGFKAGVLSGDQGAWVRRPQGRLTSRGPRAIDIKGTRITWYQGAWVTRMSRCRSGQSFKASGT